MNIYEEKYKKLLKHCLILRSTLALLAKSDTYGGHMKRAIEIFLYNLDISINECESLTLKKNYSTNKKDSE